MGSHLKKLAENLGISERHQFLVPTDDVRGPSLTPSDLDGAFLGMSIADLLTWES